MNNCEHRSGKDRMRRREMLVIGACAAGLLLPGSSRGQADAAGNPRVGTGPDAAPITSVWGAPELLGTGSLTGDSFQFVGNGNAGSMLFTGFGLDLQRAGDPLSTVRTAVFRIPVTIPHGKHLVGFRATIRGGVMKSAGARVLLVADLGGRTRTTEFPFDHQIMAASARSTITQHFDVARLKTPPTSYMGLLTLAVQRQSPQDAAVVSIDSLDLEALTR